MKFNLLLYIVLVITMNACVTGGFDENTQLDERNDALAKAPKIESISINGSLLERNTQSLRVVEAKVGDVLSISASITSGKDAELRDLEVARQYYEFDLTEPSMPLDPNAADAVYEVSGNSFVFDLNYTVPAQDDDGYDFHPGDVIYVYLRASNTLDNYGYKAFEIHIVE